MLVEAVSISLGRRQSGVEAKIIIHRVMDGSHFPVQVTAGALIGVASSVLLVASPRVADGGSLGGGAEYSCGADTEAMCGVAAARPVGALLAMAC